MNKNINKNIINDIINNNFYNRYKVLLNENTSLENIQKNIEEFSSENWKNEFLILLQNNVELFKGKNGQHMIINAIDNLEKTLEEYKYSKYTNNKKHYIIIKKVYNDIIISVVLNRIIPFIYQETDLNESTTHKLYPKVGKDIYSSLFTIEYQNYKNWYKKSTHKLENYKFIFNKEEYEFNESNLDYLSFKEKIEEIIKKELKIISTDDLDKLHIDIGIDLVLFIADIGTLFSIENQRVERNKIIRIIVAKDILNEIVNYNLNLINNNFPMVYKPNNWDLINDHPLNGGYLLNKELNNEELIHTSLKNSGETKFTKDEIVTTTLNKLQSVPYVVNTEFLDYLIQLIEQDFDFKNKIILDIHPSTNKILDLKKNNKKSELLKILQHNSIRYDTMINIMTALLLKDKTFYHPLFLDWRGRIYTKTNLLSYQSNELAKSLIMFKEGFILNENGYKHLLVYAANCYGKDKDSFTNKLEWAKLNLNNIIDIESKFWLTAEQPLLFLTAALELKNYIKDPNNFKSRLPIFVDATCNGLQHLAAMVNDVNLAKYVNLLKSSCDDIPNDIYGEMAVKIKHNISKVIKQKIFNKKTGELEDFSKLENLHITRSFIKRGIMTIAYGVTVKGVCEQLISSQFDRVSDTKRVYSLNNPEFGNTNLVFSYKEIFKLSEIIHDVLFDSYPSLRELVKYLNAITYFIHSLKMGIPVIWKTPNGLNIEQKYMKTEKKEYKYSILGKVKTLELTVKKDTISFRKQNLGVVPNLIHSMDASNISLLVESFSKLIDNFQLLTIHDCFASHANHIELLSFHVKSAFLFIYKNQNFIKDYHKETISYLKNLGLIFNKDDSILYLNNKEYKVPVVPNLEKTFDLSSNVLYSKYFVK